MAFAIADLLRLISMLFWLLMLARIIFSWGNIDRYNPIVNFIYQVTEPVLAPIRNILPSTGMIDFSPMVAILLVEVVTRVLSAIVLSVF
ncbi:MAG: YggT family protein [Chloroflexota bacterium]